MSATRGFVIFIRFVISAAFAACFAVQTSNVLTTFDPQAALSGWPAQPAIGLACILGGCHFALFAFGVRWWWAFVWACRLTIIATAGLTCLFFQQAPGMQTGALGVLIVPLLILNRIGRVRALGFFVDQNGERQQVLGSSRGHYIFKATTRGERIVKEVETRSERRKFLVIAAPILGLIGYGIYHFYLANSWVWIAVLACPAFCLTLAWLVQFWHELLYLSGNQFIEGAKVLDKPNWKPGRAEVDQQKVHGDAQFANGDEARRLLGSGRRAG